MKFRKLIIFLILLIIALSGCNKKQPAPVSSSTPSSSSTPTVTSKVVSDNSPPPYTFHKFGEDIMSAKNKNSDVVGWVYARNTLINYPVYQYKDNDYYLKRNGKKVVNVNGAIFADHRCKFNDLSQNTVIYGHNMLSGKMFGSQKRYNNLAFLKANPIIEFSTTEKDMQWKIFAVFFTPTSFYYIEPNPTTDQFMTIVNTAKEKNLFKINNVDVKPDEKILTLSTCAPTNMGNKRFVVMARLLRDGESHNLSFD